MGSAIEENRFTTRNMELLMDLGIILIGMAFGYAIIFLVMLLLIWLDDSIL